MKEVEELVCCFRELAERNRSRLKWLTRPEKLLYCGSAPIYQAGAIDALHRAVVEVQW